MDACPADTKAITDLTKCKEAAQNLGMAWTDGGDKTGNPLCHYCAGCSPFVARLSSDHSARAYWICEGSFFICLIDKGHV